MRIAIIQEKIPPYRVPFFNQLNQDLGGGLAVFSANQPGNIQFEHRPISIKRVGGWVLPRQLDSAVIGQFDLIVMMFDLRWLSLYQLLLCHHKKLVLWGHGMGSEKMLASLKAVLIKRSLGFIAYEERGEQFFISKNIPSAKLAHAGNTVEVVDHALSTKPRRYFIYMGRLQARKQLDQLIRAFSLLPKEMQNRSGLLFLGDGDVRSQLEALAADAGLQAHCQFLPETYDGAVVKSYLDRAIAYVSPGHVGLGVLHAFAYGVPVITRRNAPHAPEICNVIDGQTGLLVDDTLSALEKAMSYYLNHPDRHIEHCRAAYEHYAKARTMSKMVERFYAALVKFSCGNPK